VIYNGRGIYYGIISDMLMLFILFIGLSSYKIFVWRAWNWYL